MPRNSPFATRAARVTLVMSCLFSTSGMILVFLPRWLEVARGLEGAQIGAVLSLVQFMRIFTGPALAFWADSAADRRTPIRALSFGAVIAYAAFFLVARDFWQLMVLGLLALSLTSGVTPFVEGATLRATAEGKFSYGVARGIGTISFIAANVIGGALIDRIGVGAVVIWSLTSLVCLVGASWLGLPGDPAPPGARGRTRRAQFSSIGALLRNRRFLILIVACGLIQAGHGFYYSFSTLSWRAQGISADTVGLLWGLGGIAEVAFLWSLPLIEKRLSPEAMILAGAGGGFVRWIVMGFAPTGFVLWPLQVLHCLSFAAAHVGAMRLLYRYTPEENAGMGQTLYAALSGGLLMGCSTLLSGYLYDAIQARGYWAMAGAAFVGGVLALQLLAPVTRRPEPAKQAVP
ncbi:MFS transporter [Terricaulis sp.]|uniref:MFS transporter n=1 Tax=Terricaulis sp. TaxID=2768686 RepID=UPI0037832347